MPPTSPRSRLEPSRPVFARLDRVIPALALAVVLLAGCAEQLMPTPNLFIGRPEAFADVPSELRSTSVEVFYATDRMPSPGPRFEYGSERSDSLAFGWSTVELGEGLTWDELVAASTSALRLRGLPLRITETRELGEFAETPIRVLEADGELVPHPEAVEQDRAGHQAFEEALCGRLAAARPREVYVFVHGYNNTFEHSVFVVAQIWHFMGRRGVPVVYSWPAAWSGPLLGYARDRESGEFTVFHLKQFLRALADCEHLEKVHLVAHSRGADVLTSALRELNIECMAAGLETRRELKLGNLVLAAPDLDLDVVQQRISAERLPLVPERTTIYVSPIDRAMTIAEWLFGGRTRLGQLQPGDLTPEQVHTLGQFGQIEIVDVRAPTDWLGHSYFYANPAVSSDLILLLRDHRDPGPATGRPLTHRRDNFWQLDEGYPER